MVSSFHPHGMRKRVERVMAETGRTSCTNWAISFGVSGFRTTTHLLHGHFIFLTYLNSRLFVCSKWTIQSHIINFQPFLTSFVIFHAFTDFFLSYKTLKFKSIPNELWRCWKLAWYHHFIHIACARKLRGLRQKLDALRVQNGQSLSKYQGFRRKLICYKVISFFWTYLKSIVLLCSKCTIQSHIINFQPFLTSFVIFHAFTDYFEL